MFLFNHINLIKISIIFFSSCLILLLPAKANNLYCYSNNFGSSYEEWQASNLDLTLIDTIFLLFFNEKKQDYVEFETINYEKIKELYITNPIFTTFNHNNH